VGKKKMVVEKLTFSSVLENDALDHEEALVAGEQDRAKLPQ
jgi:hypothetical protein